MLDSYIVWLAVTELQIPIQSQISAAIFTKSTRLKNITGTGPSNTEAPRAPPAGEAAADRGGGGGGDDANQEQAGGQQEDPEVPEDSAGQAVSRQSVINLIGLDTEFCLMRDTLPSSVINLFVAGYFLVRLLGWLPIVIGVLCAGLTVPLSSVFSRGLFANVQKVVEARDEKLELIHETLQGIRQIKFSALELQWEKRLLRLRKKELAALWSYYRSALAIDACWTAGPVVLTVASLGSHAWIRGSPTPSVAFVSIGLFASLDAVMAAPVLITFGANCWVSLQRVEEYLTGPELTRSSHTTTTEN